MFIAAIQKWTRSTDLLFYLLTAPEIELIANDVLLEEYERYALKLEALNFFQMIYSVVVIVNPSEESILECMPYFPENAMADAVHAATSQQADAILISNDKHFDKIRKTGKIKVWRISEAIEKLLEF